MKKVGIILRTKNNPLLLERAVFDSILNQTFHDYNVYVINDGGDVDPIDKIRTRLPDDKRDSFFFVNLPFSLGRGGALSAGLSHSIESYTHIHNDGDTLEPEFFEKTVAFLEMNNNKNLSGVKTSNFDIYENILDGKICVYEKNDKTGRDEESIKNYLSCMLYSSFINVCSLLFRREAMLSVGSADSSIDFKEDADLIVRLMQWGDIGVIKEFLCSCHHRKNYSDRHKAGLLENDYDRNIIYENKIIREAINKKDTGKIFRANLIQSRDMTDFVLNNFSENINSLSKNIEIMNNNIKILLDKY